MAQDKPPQKAAHRKFSEFSLHTDKGGIFLDCIKIGNLIAQLRQEKGLTQQQIAGALGITNKTVSKWECGVSLR